jgi:hypothetical protein
MAESFDRLDAHLARLTSEQPTPQIEARDRDGER